MKKSEDGGTKGKQMVKRMTAKHRPLVSVAVRFVVFTCVKPLARTSLWAYRGEIQIIWLMSPRTYDTGSQVFETPGS